jgi:DNA-binding response OmpR family regulator
MKKILLVEDDQFLVRVYKVKLKELGYDVTYLSDGSEVLKTALETKPDLIMLDIVMPDKDGFAVMREIKGNPDTQNIPVMVLTNLNNESDRKTLMNLGALMFIVKANHSFKEVSDMIQGVLNNETPVVK